MDTSIEKTIERFSDRNLEKVASFWGIEVEEGADRKKVAEEMEGMRAIRSVISKLSSREKDILGIFAIKGGIIECNDLYDYHINEIELGVFPAYHWQSPKGLLGNALISAVKKFSTHGPTVFVVPDELREGISTVFSESTENMEVKKEVQINSVSSGLIDGLFKYLSFISVERPTLTKSLHQLPKKYLEKIGLANREFSFIRGICKELDLVKKEYSSIEDEYFLDTTIKAEDFVSKEEWDRAEDIFNFIIRNAEKNEIFSINGLRSLKSETWYDFDLFLKNLKNELFLDKKFDEWGKFDGIRIKRFLDRLTWLGIIEIGIIEEGVAFRITPIGGHVLGIKKIKIKGNIYKKFIIQPNFEITAFPETSREILFNLAKFTEIKSSDKVRIYLLTKNSVLGAIYRGLNSKWIVDFLCKNSQKKVPQNVLYSVKEWGSEFGDVKIKKGTFLEADEDLTDKIKSKIEAYVIKEVSPTAIVIKEKDIVSDLINMHDEVFLEVDDPVRAKEIEKKIERYIVHTFPNTIVIKKTSISNVVSCLKKNGIYPEIQTISGD